MYILGGIFVNKAHFKRHFRIYFRNNHPAYIVDEDEENYYFHRVTESKTSGGKKNWPITINPLENSVKRKLYIVKAEQVDKKSKFSLFELKTKMGVDTNYSFIKLKKDIKK